MADKKFELGDYVEVKDRIKLFYELYGQGRLVTGEVRLTNEPDGVARVMVQAFAYRSPDDPLPGVGYSWLELPGKTPYTRGSEVENAETSAWGRAIGSLGILIDRSIASANEIENKAEPTMEERMASHGVVPDVETEELIGDAKRAGMVRLRSGQKELTFTQGPDGYVVVFRLETDKGEIPQVVIGGPAGDALIMAAGGVATPLLKTRITVAGRLFSVRRPGKATYHRLKVTSWEWGDYAFPADDPELPQPPDDVPLVGETDAVALALYPDDIGAK